MATYVPMVCATCFPGGSTKCTLQLLAVVRRSHNYSFQSDDSTEMNRQHLFLSDPPGPQALRETRLFDVYATIGGFSVTELRAEEACGRRFKFGDCGASRRSDAHDAVPRSHTRGRAWALQVDP